jgi:hypothetical protein
MSESTEPTSQPSTEPESTASLPAREKEPPKPLSKVLIIRLWPKTPLLYPLALVSLIMGILTSSAELDTHISQVCGVIFLGVFFFSLFVLTIDVGLTWALLGVAGFVIVGLTGFIINIYHPFLRDLLPFLESFDPEANASFYFTVFFVWLLLMAVAYFHSRFHYVRIEPNEVMVVGGVLDKRKRFPTMGLRYTKEVVDVFEHYLPLVNSGRLVLRFSQEEEPLVLDHVIAIDKAIRHMEEITGSPK